MNQLISSAVGEKLASRLTVDYLRDRGMQGKRLSPVFGPTVGVGTGLDTFAVPG